MAKGGGGMFEIIMLVVILGGAWLLWPQISGMLNGATVGAVDTDTAGGGKADASDSGGVADAGDMGADVEDIQAKTRKMIAEITAKARAGGRGRGGIRQRNSGGSGTNISVQGKGATACVNGKCTSSYGEMQMDFSNVI